MSLFDPATLLSGLIKSLGISPDAVANLAQDVAREIAQLRADRVGFAQSSSFVVADFRARLDRIEAKLDALAGLSDVPPPVHTLTLEHTQND
jgi:hypothetical protein